MRWILGCLAAMTVAFSSIASNRCHAAVVNLSATSGLGAFVGENATGTIGFTLPGDLAGIQSFSLTVNFETNSSPVGFGTATVQAYLLQDTALPSPPPPGTSAFALGESGSMAHGITISPTYNAVVGSPSATFSGSFLQGLYNFGPLVSPGLWDDAAGSTFNVFYYVSGTSGPTSVTVRANSASLTLTYDQAGGGGGAIPEPSTLAIALVGLAGWRGRKLVRRRS